MRFFLVLFLSVILIFIGVQAYRLHEQQDALITEMGSLDDQANALLLENQKFSGDLEYLQNDRNAAKELQSKFNYRKPDEKMYLLSPVAPAR